MNPRPEDLTIRRLADICGLAMDTVTDALCRRPGYEEATREFVLQKMREYGYDTEPWTREQSAKKIRNLAVVAPGQTTNYVDHNLRRLTRMLRDKGYHSYVYFLEPFETLEIRELQVEGYILMHGDFPKLQQQLLKHKIPHVFFDTDAELGESPSLVVDREIGGKMAAEYFLNRGHEHFGIISDTPQAGFVNGIHEKGFNLDFRFSTPDVLTGDSAVTSLEKAPHTAFWIESLRAQVAFSIACEKHDIMISRDISTLYWGTTIEEFHNFADLSCIGRFGHNAVRIILEMLGDYEMTRTFLEKRQRKVIPMINDNGSVADLRKRW